MSILKRICLTVTATFVLLGLAIPEAIAARKFNAAQMQFLVPDTVWEFSTTCGSKEDSPFGGTITFGVDNSFVFDGICEHSSMGDVYKKYKGTWSLEENSICINNVKPMPGNEGKLINIIPALEQCLSLAKNKYGITFIDLDGSEMYQLKIKRHPKASSMSQLLGDVKKIEMQRTAMQRPSTSKDETIRLKQEMEVARLKQQVELERLRQQAELEKAKREIEIARLKRGANPEPKTKPAKSVKNNLPLWAGKTYKIEDINWTLSFTASTDGKKYSAKIEVPDGRFMECSGSLDPSGVLLFPSNCSVPGRWSNRNLTGSVYEMEVDGTGTAGGATFVNTELTKETRVAEQKPKADEETIRLKREMEVARLKQQAELERFKQQAELERLRQQAELEKAKREIEIARLRRGADVSRRADAVKKRKEAKARKADAEEEERLWASVKGSQNSEDLQKYLTRSPQGGHANEAKAKLKVLKKFASISDINFGNYYALVIGINEYKNLPKLKTAVGDATAVAEVLEKNYGFKVKLMLDVGALDIVDAFDELRETLTYKDNLLIYYAGHGWLDDDTGQGYWMPVDAKPNRRSRWVSNSTLKDTLKSLSAKHVMVVADSCFSGTLIRGANIGIKSADYWRKMAKKQTRVAITSGGLEPVADANGKSKHSPFATAFLKVLRENDVVIDGTTLFNKIRRPVMLSAEQTPAYSDVRGAGHEGGDFLFVRTK